MLVVAQRWLNWFITKNLEEIRGDLRATCAVRSRHNINSKRNGKEVCQLYRWFLPFIEKQKLWITLNHSPLTEPSFYLYTDKSQASSCPHNTLFIFGPPLCPCLTRCNYSDSVMSHLTRLRFSLDWSHSFRIKAGCEADGKASVWVKKSYMCKETCFSILYIYIIYYAYTSHASGKFYSTNLYLITCVTQIISQVFVLQPIT